MIKIVKYNKRVYILERLIKWKLIQQCQWYKRVTKLIQPNKVNIIQ